MQEIQIKISSNSHNNETFILNFFSSILKSTVKYASLHCSTTKTGQGCLRMYGPCSPVSLTGAETAGRKGGHEEWDGHLNKHIK